MDEPSSTGSRHAGSARRGLLVTGIGLALLHVVENGVLVAAGPAAGAQGLH